MLRTQAITSPDFSLEHIWVKLQSKGKIFGIVFSFILNIPILYKERFEGWTMNFPLVRNFTYRNILRIRINYTEL